MSLNTLLWADIKIMIYNLLSVLFKLLLSPNVVNATASKMFSLFRKSFGATLVKRVRKAGSDFMNKVPRVSTQVLVNEKLLILWLFIDILML